MSRVLLVDDSPHAQRMGERLLREEGHEVVTVTDGLTALLRLADFDPDLVLADVELPRKSGYEICEYVKNDSRYRHMRVVLTAGVLDAVNEAEILRVRADGVLNKPFEASVVMTMVQPLFLAAAEDRAKLTAEPELPPPVVKSEAELVRAAVIVALDAAWPTVVDETTKRVLLALGLEPNAGQ